MRKFLYKFVSNLISLLLILVIGGILTLLLCLSTVCIINKSGIVASLGCLGLIGIFISIIITIIQFLEPYHPIDKLAKLITGYNETDETRII